MSNLNLWRNKFATTQPLLQSAEAPPVPRVVRPLLRVVVLNTKGGCGKTTLSTNLAGYYASHDFQTAILDMDPQGSSLHWLANRSQKHASIVGIQGTERGNRVTRSFQLRIPPDTERLIVDTPAGLEPMRLQDVTRGADAILIPVLPSDIDIHAASRCVADLLIAGRIERRADRVAVIANRVKKNTQMYDKLRRFLDTLEIPFVATFRDTQNYAHASEQGLCVHELEARNAREDVRQLNILIDWIESRQQLSAAPTTTPDNVSSGRL
ncbi:MAG TPA: AAA family ATPase [Gammaproteobacteria bacterium]|jgi:chromosome partitioning protein|nr:AAA family ATPase [Gammaproteobacteria bacterium]